MPEQEMALIDTIYDRSVPGVILAGGLATRMGGLDKCLQYLDENHTILDSIIGRLQPQCRPLAINANGDGGRFSDFQLPVIADSMPNYPGPLGGILAALDWAAEQNSQWVVTVAGDTPFFPTDLVACLMSALDDENALIAYAQSVDQEGNVRPHPIFGIWATDLRDDLRATLQRGQRKVRVWAAHHSAITVTFPFAKPDSFLNINTPEELAVGRKYFQQCSTLGNKKATL